MRYFFILFLFIGSLAEATDEYYNLNPYDSSFSPKANSVIKVDNMPAIKSQDTLGICFAAAASTLLSAENCRYKKISSCSSIPEKEMFSILDLSQYGWSVGGGTADSSSTYEIHAGGEISKVTWKVGELIGSAASEECMSIDKALSKLGGAKGEGLKAQQVFWESLKAKYESLKKKCPTCTAEMYSSGGNDQADELANFVSQNLNLKRTNQEVLKAFSQDSYEKFLYDILLPAQCVRAAGQANFAAWDHVQVLKYPDRGKGNYAGAIKQIKDTLNSGRPLGLDGICLEKVPTNDCKQKHALVIAGYRTVCNQKNECHETVKVVNSWGQRWQEKNDDGWIDARAVLDSTLYKEGVLSWFADK